MLTRRPYETRSPSSIPAGYGGRQLGGALGDTPRAVSTNPLDDVNVWVDGADLSRCGPPMVVMPVAGNPDMMTSTGVHRSECLIPIVASV
jgi:hypothetical protein